ncbi:MAG: hypothetical protein SWK76_14895 [Actinomycetota bacterium]|nr:hypothetical protein [Actinomycetota bacterium]
MRKREIDRRPVNDGFRSMAGMSGYGRYEVVGYRHEQDVDGYIIETISKPYSVPLACGDIADAFEVIYGCELGVRYEIKSPDLYEVTCYVSNHPREFKGRLRFE